MKRNIFRVFLIVLMVLSFVGIIEISVTNYKVMGSIFSYFDSPAFLQAQKCYFSIALLTVCFVVLLFLLTKLSNKSELFSSSKKDDLTGLGNIKILEKNFNKKNLNYENRVCVTYISFDAESATHNYGKESCDRLQKIAADILESNCTDFDCVVKIADGTFAMILRCIDGAQAQKRVIDMISRLNKYEYRLLLETNFPFKAGIYLLDNEKIPFSTAFSFAKTGYRYACDTNVDTLVFTTSLLEKDELKKNLQNKLSTAIDNKEFDMFLQFVHDVEKDKFIGAEVLSRWNSPEEGFIMPAHYIGDMCATGVIEKFDMYMLDKTCAILEEWSTDENYKDLMLSCNITRITISSENFIKNFKNIVKKYKFNHASLILEITEDTLIDNRAVAFKNITDCKAEGFKVALDDFGAGISSLSDINDYPIDQLKIDRQLINQSNTQKGISLLQGIIQLAHKLDLKVVCEGVETQKQVDIISKTGCDYIQGYYYSYVFSVDEGKIHYLNSLKK